MFALAIVLLMAAAGFCWVKADRAWETGDFPAVVGYGALYAAVATLTLLST